MMQTEEDEVDYEEMGVAETYAEYWPAKCRFFLSILSCLNTNSLFNLILF